MTHRSPLVTLIGLVAAFAIMFGVNLAVTDATAGSADPGAAPSATAGASAPATSAPATSAPPTPSASAPASPSATEDEPGEQFPEEVVYAGRTEDGSVAVAVAVRGDKAAAYLCDGESVESWLRGTVEDGDTLSLRNKNGSNELEARLDDGRLEGKVDLNGDALEFSLVKAEKPAGLYRARGAKTTIGWIVLPDGSQVGVQTTGEESTPAPELDPAQPEVTVDGEALTGEPVSGDQDV